MNNACLVHSRNVMIFFFTLLAANLGFLDVGEAFVGAGSGPDGGQQGHAFGGALQADGGTLQLGAFGE
jgi:hypothetical protein